MMCYDGNILKSQVYSRASDQESCGWWRAIVKMIKVLDQSLYFVFEHIGLVFRGVYSYVY